MNEKQSISDEQLDARLTAEAADHSPAFSQDLHERIMNRIANSPAVDSPRPHWRWPAIAAAAVMVLGLCIYLKVSNRMNIPPRRVVAIRAMPSIPPIRNPVRALDQPITEWNDARYAYLDRDGQKLWGYMTRQMDVMPVQR
jgi:hypothetical protein